MLSKKKKKDEINEMDLHCVSLRIGVLVVGMPPPSLARF